MQPLRRGDTGSAVVEIRRMLSQFGLLSAADDTLDGPADPASSSPNTANGVTLEARNRRKAAAK